MCGNRPLFADKTKNLNGEVLNVVYLDHVPSVIVMTNNDTQKIGGVEIEVSFTETSTLVADFIRFGGPYLFMILGIYMYFIVTSKIGIDM